MCLKKTFKKDTECKDGALFNPMRIAILADTPHTVRLCSLLNMSCSVSLSATACKFPQVHRLYHVVISEIFKLCFLAPIKFYKYKSP